MDDHELLTITYKGKQYSFKELVEENNTFSNSLKLPEFRQENHSSFHWAFRGDYGYMIASEKLEQFYSLLATARFTLTQAHQKLHKSPVEWRSGYLGQLWLRVQYLKNAVIWYNSCDDYLLQIIWFAFDFFNANELTEQDKYVKVMKSCTWVKVVAELKKFDNNNDAQSLLTEINKFRSIDVRLEANELANSLKHRANVHFTGLDYSYDFHVTSDAGFDSSAIQPLTLDIDATCDLLQKVHVAVVGFAKYLIKFIDFDSALPIEKDGVRDMADAPVKKVYKKFYIND